MRRIVLFALSSYKLWVSPLLPRSCRFSPTCSEYALLVFRDRGLVRATALTVMRLARCHPWCAGGIDLPPRG